MPETEGDGNVPNPPKTKKKLSKGALIGLISGGAVLVAAIVLGIIFLPSILSPKKKVRNAIEKTFDAEYIQKANAMEEYLGVSEMAKSIKEKGGNAYSEVEFNSVAGTDELNGFGVGFEAAIDKKAKKLSGDFTMKNGGNTVLDIQLIADENNTYLTIPEAINGYLSISNKNLVSSYNNSFFVKNGITQELNVGDFDLDYFGLIESFSGAANSEIVEKIDKIADELWENAEIKKDGSEKINIGGKEKKCKKYTVTYKKADIVDALGKCIDEYQNIYLKNIDMIKKFGGDLDEDTLKQVFSQVKSGLTQVIPGDIKISYYLYDGNVVRVQYKDDVKISGVSLGINVDFKFTGSDNVFSDIDGVIEFAVQGQTLGVKITSSQSKDGGTVTTKANATVSIPTVGDAKLDIKTVYKDSDKTFNMEVNGEAAGKNASIIATGKFDSIEKGKKFDLTLDSIKVNALGQDIMDMKVKYGISVEPNVKQIDSSKKVVDVFNCTMEDVQNFIVENQDSITKYFENLSGIFGNLGISNPYSGSGTNTTTEAYTEETTEAYTEEYTEETTEQSTESTEAGNSGDFSAFTQELKDGRKVVVKKGAEGYSCTDANEYSLVFSKDATNYYYYSAQPYLVDTTNTASNIMDSCDQAYGASEHRVDSQNIGDGIYVSYATYNMSGINMTLGVIIRDYGTEEGMLVMYTAMEDNVDPNFLASLVSDEYLSIQ